MDREDEADVPIVGIIFFIIHVIYTMLHLFIYCYVGETLLGQVESISSFINRVVQLVFLVFSKKKKKKLNTLVFQSTGIGLSTYHCNWYDLPSRRAVLLMIVIRRANVSFQITAGKFSPFSLEFFNAVSGKKKKKKNSSDSLKISNLQFQSTFSIQVLKTSAGYLSVLLAMKDRLVEGK